MKFGVCGSSDAAAALKSAGFSYLEVNLVNTFQPEKGEEIFAAQFEQLSRSALAVEVANVFLPGDLALCGSAADVPRQRRYVETAMDRAARAGIRVVVFGSGKARAVPDGFDRDRAWAQLVEFTRGIVAPSAERNGITVAVEPLNRAECNILNSVAEGAAFVREVNRPAIRLLVDAYHWLRENESPAAIVEAGDLIRHAHIATAAHRMAPGLEPQDFQPFFSALRQIGYAGRVSVEARFNNLAEEAALVFEALTAAAQGAS